MKEKLLYINRRASCYIYTINNKNNKNRFLFRVTCYRPSVISVTVTKGGPLRSSGLYRTSGTIGQGVAELRKRFNI